MPLEYVRTRQGNRGALHPEDGSRKLADFADVCTSGMCAAGTAQARGESVGK
uniref:Uncharacterized protein n=1 Tax=Tetraselmis sp. GSL018 TaxID=582737 RepID=A0A061QMW4_9CHLO